MFFFTPILSNEIHTNMSEISQQLQKLQGGLTFTEQNNAQTVNNFPFVCSLF